MITAGVRRWEAIARGVVANEISRAPVVNLTPQLVLAVMAREVGNGDPRAMRREPDGRISRGLMQVLESTARDLGLKDPMQLHVPAVGITYGVRYLANQLRRYNGSIPRAVAAYNAGSARYQPDERFVNQPYVDFILARFAELKRGAAAAAPFGARIVALTLFVVAAAALASRPRRAA